MPNIKKSLKVLRKALTQLVLQKTCSDCGQTLCDNEEFLCNDCWTKLRFSMIETHCKRCGRKVSRYTPTDNGCGNCQNQKFEFDSIACLGIYAEVLRNLILKFKFSDRTNLLRPLAEFANLTLNRAKFKNEIDYLVPVPLHWRRKWSRGYNQSALLAKKLKADKAKINYDLVRLRYTTEQARLGKAARKKNVKDAFAVRKGHNFNGKNVCLIDDVKTTGATLNECAKVLKQAGTKKVFALVIAVAGQGKG